MNLPNSSRILVVAPHPDDEVLSSGALLLHLRALANTIDIHYVTSGSDSSLWDLREDEARKVCSQLGATPTFHWLDREGDPLKYSRSFASIIAAYCPGMIIMPSSHDQHPAHMFTCEMVNQAITLSLFTGTILRYSIWNPLPDPDYLFQFENQLLKRKIQLLSIYQSQLKNHDFIPGISGLNTYYGLLSSENSAEWNKKGKGFSDEWKVPGRNSSGAWNGQGGEEKKMQVYAEGFELQKSMRSPAILAFGDIFLDILPEPIHKSISEGSSRTQITHSTGGNAGNFAIASAHLGNQSCIYAPVANDWRSRILMENITESGARPFLVKKKSCTTAMTLGIAFKDGTRHFISDFGANLFFDEDDIPFSDPKCWEHFRHLHRAGYFWLPGLQGKANLSILEMAKKAELTTSIDVGTPISVLGKTGCWKEEDIHQVQELMKYIDVFFGNEVEILGAAELGGEEAGGETGAEQASEKIYGAASILLAKGVKIVVVHRGEKGASLYTHDTILHSPAQSVPVENPTGAGDVFNAAFIHAYLEDRELEDCLTFATAAGTLHVAKKGIPYPHRKEIEECMKETAFSDMYYSGY